jgi:predicted transcriptional regulator YheO
MFDIKFTKEDEKIINSYEAVAESIALFLGEYCEVALYTLEKPKGFLKKIKNSKHTKRKLHSEFTEQGMQVVNDFISTKKQELVIYTTSSSNGEPMRSIFTVITNADKPIGLLDINFNMNIPLSEFISTFSLFQIPSTIQKEDSTIKSKDVASLIHNAVNDIVLEISTDRTIPNHEKK